MKTPTMLVAVALAACPFARADITNWYNTTTGTANNVVASTSGSGGGQTGANGGGWAFNGTTGISFDYGALGTNSTNFGTVEYIFNLSDPGASGALGSFAAWNTEINVMKLEQYNNTGTFGFTLSGVSDYKFTADGTSGGAGVASIFNTTTVATFVMNGGDWSLYINGNLVGSDTRTTNNSVLRGGVGTLGSGNSLSADKVSGTILGVSSYARALSASEVSANYAAFAAVPEPSTYGLLGAGALAAVALARRRRKVA